MKIISVSFYKLTISANVCSQLSQTEKSILLFLKKKKKLNERFFKVLYNFHKVHIPDFIYLIMAPFAPILICPSLATTGLFSVPVNLFLFCSSHQLVVFFRFHIKVISYSICLSLSYLTQHNTLQLHSCCCKWQNAILFYDKQYSIMCVCVYIYTIASLSIYLLIDTQVISIQWQL